MPDIPTLRTAAQLYISDWNTGAREGLSDFESTLSASTDYGPILAALAANIVWATGAFATGGVAFAAGLVGAFGGPASLGASSAVDRNAFHTVEAARINDVAQALQGRVDTVVRDVHTQATAGRWDEQRTRNELIGRLLQPQFIGGAGTPTPFANRRTIARDIQFKLVVKANEASTGGVFTQPSHFDYNYSVSNHGDTHMFGPDEIYPVSRWRTTRGATTAHLPAGDQAAIDVLRTEPLLQPADMQISKRVYIQGSSPEGRLDITLDGSNAVSSVRGHGIFSDFGTTSRPASRSPPTRDPEGMARTLLAQMWADTGGRPPWVRGQDLTIESAMSRSRATR